MPSTIAAYNSAQPANEKKTCTALAKLIDKGLPKAEKKIWHGHPVWFDDGNPLVGFAVRKAGVQLLFWSGRSFDEPELLDEGTFKAAHVHFTSVDEIRVTKLARWLRKAKKIQWDYKNIVKRRGVLERSASGRPYRDGRLVQCSTRDARRLDTRRHEARRKPRRGRPSPLSTRRREARREVEGPRMRQRAREDGFPHDTRVARRRPSTSSRGDDELLRWPTEYGFLWALATVRW